MSEVVETPAVIWRFHTTETIRQSIDLQNFEPIALSHLKAARTAAEKAYAPYSNFRVGASVLVAGKDPREFTGCNIENASYGATMCAERVAINTAVAAGFHEFTLLALSTLDSASEEDLSNRSPCGLCRQVMSEFFSPETLILIDGGTSEAGQERIDVTTIDAVLPWRFELAK